MDQEEGGGMTHDEVWNLLPWFANATLARAEADSVRAHLPACPTCQRELGRCQAMLELSTIDESQAPVPHPAQIESLLARAEALETDESGEVIRPDLTVPLRRARWPRAAVWLLAGQFAALAILAVMAVGARDRRAQPVAPSFRTLSAPEVGDAAPRLRLVFAAGTTELRVRELLLEIGAEIVGGPSPLGVYTIALPRGERAEPPLWVVEHLRSRPEVRFAELDRRAKTSE